MKKKISSFLAFLIILSILFIFLKNPPLLRAQDPGYVQCMWSSTQNQCLIWRNRCNPCCFAPTPGVHPGCEQYSDDRDACNEALVPCINPTIPAIGCGSPCVSSSDCISAVDGCVICFDFDNDGERECVKPSTPPPAGTIIDPMGGRFNTIGDVINRLIPYIFALAGIILLFLIIWGGFDYLTSGGDPKKVESAGGKITHAVVGFIIIFVAYWLVQILETIFGIQIF